MAEIQRLKTRVENLESLVASLRREVDLLRGTRVVPVARNLTRTQYSVDMDSTGTIFEDSLEKMLHELTSQGDIDFSEILAALRREAFGKICDWRPIKLEIKPKKKDIVRWMLSADNVHKFKSNQVISTVGNCSVWTKLVGEVFLEQSRDRKKKANLVRYFQNAAKSQSFFAGFVKSLVRVHRERCQSCVSPSP